MQEFLFAIQGSISQGVILGIMALGVFLTYKILDYPDLTVDGSFTTGASVAAILIVNGTNPYIATLMAAVSGMLAGLVTGFLHAKLHIPNILSGILTQIALYSINIRIMGKSNIPLLGVDTVVSDVSNRLGGNLTNTTVTTIIGVVVSAFIIATLYWFFGTEIGSCVRATGNNEDMVKALGVNTNTMKILALVLSNGLVAISGALTAQVQGYSDVGMGIGTIVIGLASVIIGGVFMSRFKSFAVAMLSVIVGAVVYRTIIAIVLQMGLKSTDLNLLTAIVVVIALTLPNIIGKLIPATKPKLKE